MDTDSPRLRMSILGIVIVSLFGTLFARLWYLQVMASEQFQEVAVANTERLVYEEAPRGRILDREGRVIVDNRTSLIIAVRPNELDDSGRRDEVLLRVAQELTAGGSPTKVAALERRLEDPQYDPLEPIPVAIDVPEELQVVIAEHPEDFPGVTVSREAVRAYPYGPVAAHIVGYVGRINETELEQKQGTLEAPKENPKPYQPDASIGKTGVEQVMEDELRGTPGVKRVEVDAKGNVVRTALRPDGTPDETQPVPGNDIVLAMDLDVQRDAEEALREQLELVRGYPTDSGYAQGRAGSVVALDPRDGAVLALASYPTFDPSEFVNGISTARYEELTGGDPADNAFINRAIGGLYAPGSTFKLVTATAALRTGLLDEPPEGLGQTYGDNGVYVIANCTGNCERQNAGRKANGTVDLATSLQVSSDVYYYRIGDEFYARSDQFGDAMQSTARDYGFGAPTGIDLPGELGGVVPDAEWKRTLYESLPPDQQANGDPTWYPGDSINLSIGQGDMLATPLQLVNAYATFVARGEQHRPYVVWKVLAPGSESSTPGLGDAPIDPTTGGTTPGTTPDGTADGAATDETAALDPTASSSTTSTTLELDPVTGLPIEPEPPEPPGPEIDLSQATVLREVTPEVRYTFDLPGKAFNPIHEGLLDVARVGNVHVGTAAPAFGDFDTAAFPIISKTGTAQKNGRVDTALFVACGPDPRSTICLGTVIEESGYGGTVAAPVLRRILEPIAGQETTAGQRPQLAEGTD